MGCTQVPALPVGDCQSQLTHDVWMAQGVQPDSLLEEGLLYCSACLQVHLLGGHHFAVEKYLVGAVSQKRWLKGDHSVISGEAAGLGPAGHVTAMHVAHESSHSKTVPQIAHLPKPYPPPMPDKVSRQLPPCTRGHWRLPQPLAPFHWASAAA